MITSIADADDASRHIKASRRCRPHVFTDWQNAWCAIPAIMNPQAQIGYFRYCKKCGKLDVTPHEVLGGDYPIDVAKLNYSDGWKA
jgi:hypothetical protein